MKIYFNASPEPVKKCGKVLLAGEVWDPSIDDQSAGSVGFFFKKAGTSKYVYKGADWSIAYNGRYSKRVTQCSSGTWKAELVVGDWTGPSVRDAVKVR